MLRLMIAAALSFAASAAIAGDTIEGNWKTKNGETAAISACGGDYCITVKTGKYKGSSLGRISGSGNRFTGVITDPSENKDYAGGGTLSGNRLRMTGCVMKVFCRTETWTRL